MLNKKALAASVSAPPAEFVEDVFSTWLYKGNDATQTITNGIDLSGKGGLVFVKNRSNAYGGFAWYDTVRGVRNAIQSNSTAAQLTAQAGSELTAFNNNGFSLGTNDNCDVNLSPDNYCSWTFREQAKFFDVVTYTGNGTARTVAHNLGSVPGMIIVKRTDTTGDWQVYHRANTANPETDYLVLNSTAATADSDTRWNDTLPTSTVFSLGTDATVNANTGTYVAYLFAHDAGGFGTAGTDNVISCGSFTTNGSGQATISLGYEPQYILAKKSSGGGGDWMIFDVMRGTSYTNASILYANSSGTGVNLTYSAINLTATGFNTVDWFDGTSTYIYMAIRRPMKVPTTGTSVFSPNAVNVSSGTKVTTGFPVDWQINFVRTEANYNGINFSRLLGVSSNDTNSGQVLWTTKTDAQASYNGSLGWDNTGFKQSVNLFPDQNNIYWNFKRAPGFFDQVCYTGTGSATTFNHNLGVVPELMIVKKRSATDDWAVYAGDNTDFLLFNTTAATADDNTYWNDTTPTSTVFSVGTNADVNTSAATYVAYLFATLAGVSKVGTYTGTAAAQTINCGFTAGARFVMIKRTDSTGDWYVWDTARGIISGNDPYLLINSTAAEVTNTDYVDPVSSGFELSSTAPAAINSNGGTFIFLAIA
jgi:hypothetical protein